MKADLTIKNPTMEIASNGSCISKPSWLSFTHQFPYSPICYAGFFLKGKLQSTNIRDKSRMENWRGNYHATSRLFEFYKSVLDNGIYMDLVKASNSTTMWKFPSTFQCTLLHLQNISWKHNCTPKYTLIEPPPPT